VKKEKVKHTTPSVNNTDDSNEQKKIGCTFDHVTVWNASTGNGLPKDIALSELQIVDVG